VVVQVADDTALPEAGRLSSVLGREVEVVSLRDPAVPLLQELVRDAIVVREGEPHAAARWRANALLDLQLDPPWYDRMRDAWLRRVAERGLFRNVVAHGYVTIDPAIVYRAASEGVGDLERFAREIAVWSGAQAAR
jgi:hypothetical protein